MMVGTLQVIVTWHYFIKHWLAKTANLAKLKDTIFLLAKLIMAFYNYHIKKSSNQVDVFLKEIYNISVVVNSTMISSVNLRRSLNPSFALWQLLTIKKHHCVFLNLFAILKSCKIVFCFEVRICIFPKSIKT